MGFVGTGFLQKSNSVTTTIGFFSYKSLYFEGYATKPLVMYMYFEFGPVAVVVSSKNSPQHIYLLEKHFLHAISKLPEK